MSFRIHQCLATPRSPLLHQERKKCAKRGPVEMFFDNDLSHLHSQELTSITELFDAGIVIPQCKGLRALIQQLLDVCGRIIVGDFGWCRIGHRNQVAVKVDMVKRWVTRYW